MFKIKTIIYLFLATCVTFVDLLGHETNLLSKFWGSLKIEIQHGTIVIIFISSFCYIFSDISDFDNTDCHRTLYRWWFFIREMIFLTTFEIYMTVPSAIVLILHARATLQYINWLISWLLWFCLSIISCHDNSTDHILVCY